jgi:branched-chain amino acid transport system substrate-binding protein
MMMISRRGILGASVAVAVAPLKSAHAQRPKIKIGVLADLSGPYRDI